LFSKGVERHEPFHVTAFQAQALKEKERLIADLQKRMAPG
jgi:hypothetical protein